jgi:hypothetical protein
LKVNDKNAKIRILPPLRCFGFLTIYFQKYFCRRDKISPGASPFL